MIAITLNDNLVQSELRELGGKSTAVDLCKKLEAHGFKKGDCQLAIQRSFDRQAIKLNDDWSVRLGM